MESEAPSGLVPPGAEPAGVCCQRVYVDFRNAVRNLHQNVTQLMDIRQWTFEGARVTECRDGRVHGCELGPGWLCATVVFAPPQESGGNQARGSLSVDIVPQLGEIRTLHVSGNVVLSKTVSTAVCPLSGHDRTGTPTLMTLVSDGVSLRLTRVQQGATASPERSAAAASACAALAVGAPTPSPNVSAVGGGVADAVIDLVERGSPRTVVGSLGVSSSPASGGSATHPAAGHGSTTSGGRGEYVTVPEERRRERGEREEDPRRSKKFDLNGLAMASAPADGRDRSSAPGSAGGSASRSERGAGESSSSSSSRSGLSAARAEKRRRAEEEGSRAGGGSSGREHAGSESSSSGSKRQKGSGHHGERDGATGGSGGSGGEAMAARDGSGTRGGGAAAGAVEGTHGGIGSDPVAFLNHYTSSSLIDGASPPTVEASGLNDWLAEEEEGAGHGVAVGRGAVAGGGRGRDRSTLTVADRPADPAPSREEESMQSPQERAQQEQEGTGPVRDRTANDCALATPQIEEETAAPVSAPEDSPSDNSNRPPCIDGVLASLMRLLNECKDKNTTVEALSWLASDTATTASQETSGGGSVAASLATVSSGAPVEPTAPPCAFATRFAHPWTSLPPRPSGDPHSWGLRPVGEIRPFIDVNRCPRVALDGTPLPPRLEPVVPLGAVADAADGPPTLEPEVFWARDWWDPPPQRDARGRFIRRSESELQRTRERRRDRERMRRERGRATRRGRGRGRRALALHQDGLEIVESVTRANATPNAEFLSPEEAAQRAAEETAAATATLMEHLGD